MQKMALFDTQEEENNKAAEEFINNELGIDLYGNSKLYRAFIEFYNRGMIHSNDQAYLEYKDIAKEFGNSSSFPERRSILVSVSIDPIDQFFDRNPSNDELRSFIELSYEARLFINEFETADFDYDKIKDLDKTSFFSSVEPTTALILINVYGYDALVQYASFPKNMNSDALTIMLHSIEAMNIKPELDKLFYLAKQVDVKQATIIDYIAYAGFDIDRFLQVFSDIELFKLAAKVVYKFVASDINELPVQVNEIPARILFMLRFVYMTYSVDELTSFRPATTMGVYLYPLFKNCVNNLYHDDSFLTRLLYFNNEVNSIEIVIDCVSECLIPIDAAIDTDTIDYITNLWGGTEYFNVTTNGKKLVIYWFKQLGYSLPLGERSFNQGFDLEDIDMEDAYNENNFMDVCYEGALTRATMTDMYCISYLYSTDNVEHKIKEFFNLPMKVRYAYFLMILSINKGNAVTCKDVFNKDDLMAKWISALHLYIRPDDDLLSAFLRINFAIAKVDFNIYNKRLTINDASFSITGRSFNLFSVFGNDRSFIEEIASNPEGTIKEFC